MAHIKKTTPCLSFDDQGKAAAEFYTGIFPNSRITNITHYPAVGQALHGRAAGSVMTVDFDLDGEPFTALNGGPEFQFNQAISFMINCETQDEVDYYWEKLSEGGEQLQCGWLKDKFGISWQITPIRLIEMISDPDPEKVQRAFAAMLQMTKIDIAALNQAYEQG